MLPAMGSAINTDTVQSRDAWVTIDVDMNTSGNSLSLLFGGHSGAVPPTLPVVKKVDRLAVRLTVPPSSFVMYKN